ncbi:cytochrome oxidase assembly protein 1 [Spiromyces aspiralis]|uniref:Cytochrome oxidase assembly protein 1 n=1 Tax=Spiromyces aspiralis TaxID=68401 RepID=A0ACC1HUA4_9FUNG|nr:cytochrome oxidase assembly protein 1 [Spiromyces aspiralis]
MSRVPIRPLAGLNLLASRYGWHSVVLPQASAQARAVWTVPNPLLDGHGRQNPPLSPPLPPEAAARNLDNAVASNPAFTIERELPTPKSYKREVTLFLIAAIATWGIGTTLAFNYQRFTSSAVTTILFSARHNPEIQKVFGNYLNFTSIFPWISGEVSNLQGIVDVSFRVKGDNGATGQLVFLSRRIGKGNDAKWVTEKFYIDVDGSAPQGQKHQIELSL